MKPKIIDENKLFGLEKKQMSRRQLIVSGGKVAAGVAGVGLISSITGGFEKSSQANASTRAVTVVTADEDAANVLPFEYNKITAIATAKEQAYQNWYTNYCMFAVMGALVKAQRDMSVHDTRFDTLPLSAYVWGHGGGATWGTLCGSINGAANFVGLVYGKSTVGDSIIRDLFGWYASTQLPIYTPTAQVGTIKALATNASQSPLCHVSVGTWMDAQQAAEGSGADGNAITFGSAERKDRCARLSADVVAKVISLMNAEKDGTLNATNKKPMSDATVGHPAPQYNCTNCHTDTDKVDVTSDY